MVMGLAYPTNMCTPVQAENWTQKKVGNYVKSWSWPGNIQKLSPDCKGIFQSLKALKVISPAVSEDILLAEAVFAHNSKLRKDTKLSPFQLVKGKQSEPPLVDDTVKLTHSSTNRLKHLGVQAQEKKSGDPQEVTNQHTSLVGYSAELAVKGNSQQVYNSHQSKPCKCGCQQSPIHLFQERM